MDSAARSARLAHDSVEEFGNKREAFPSYEHSQPSIVAAVADGLLAGGIYASAVPFRRIRRYNGNFGRQRRSDSQALRPVEDH